MVTECMHIMRFNKHKNTYVSFKDNKVLASYQIKVRKLFRAQVQWQSIKSSYLSIRKYKC